MKNIINAERQKRFSPHFMWRKIYKKTLDTGIAVPLVYTFLYLISLRLGNLNPNEKNAYMFFFWIGLASSLLVMIEIFRTNYKLVYLKSQPSQKKGLPKDTHSKTLSGKNYPKLSYPGGKELKVEYDDRVDYYRFEDGKFSYCGSVKKDHHKQIR